jgi:hypothetical protein
MQCTRKLRRTASGNLHDTIAYPSAQLLSLRLFLRDKLRHGIHRLDVDVLEPVNSPHRDYNRMYALVSSLESLLVSTAILSE